MRENITVEPLECSNRHKMIFDDAARCSHQIADLSASTASVELAQEA